MQADLLEAASVPLLSAATDRPAVRYLAVPPYLALAQTASLMLCSSHNGRLPHRERRRSSICLSPPASSCPRSAQRSCWSHCCSPTRRSRRCDRALPAPCKPCSPDLCSHSPSSPVRLQVKLSTKSFGKDAAQVAALAFTHLGSKLLDLDLSDSIAGRPEEEASWLLAPHRGLSSPVQPRTISLREI